MPAAEWGHSVSVIDGQIYIIGAGNEGCGFLRFAPGTGVWRTLASTLHGRYCATSFVLGGCLFAAGGISSSSRTVEHYDVATDTWTVVVSMLESRHSFGAVTIGPMGPANSRSKISLIH
jgi:hypothetical protein